MPDTITQQERAEARRYTLVIEWSDENDAYLAIAPDLPGLVTDGRTPAEAAAMGEEAVVTLLASLRKWGQPVPAPSFSALPEDLRPAHDLAAVAK
jgi:predicted RNase H-like HicB family nuclease